MSWIFEGGGAWRNVLPIARSRAGARLGPQWTVLYVKGRNAPPRADTPRAGNGDTMGGPVVSWAAGSIRLRDRRLIDAANPALCRAFLQRVFRLEEVHSVEIDWEEAVALIRFAQDEPSDAEVLA